MTIDSPHSSVLPLVVTGVIVYLVVFVVGGYAGPALSGMGMSMWVTAVLIAGLIGMIWLMIQIGPARLMPRGRP